MRKNFLYTLGILLGLTFWAYAQQNTNNSEIKGEWIAKLESDGTMQLVVTLSDENQDNDRVHYWNWNHNDARYRVDEFSGIQFNKEHTFKLLRASGEIIFKGAFIGKAGAGDFVCRPNPQFIDFIKKEGYRGVHDHSMISAILANVSTAYIKEIQDAGYNDISLSMMANLKRRNIDGPYIRQQLAELKKLGYDEVSASKIIAFKKYNITPQYIRSIQQAGFPDISLSKFVRFKKYDVTVNYLTKYRQALSKMGYNDVSASKFIAFKKYEITPQYIQTLQDAGLNNLHLSKAIKLHKTGITADQVKIDLKALQSLGYNEVSTTTYLRMKKYDITPEYIKGVQNAGFGEVSINKIYRLYKYGITTATLQKDLAALKKLGYNDLSLNRYLTLKKYHVTPTYIQDMIQTGLENISLSKIAQLKKRNFTKELIQNYMTELKPLGYRDLSVNDLVKLRKYDISTNYIKDMHRMGFDNASLRDIVKFKKYDITLANTAPYLKQMNKLGFKDISAYELLKLKKYGVTISFVKDAQNKGFKSTSVQRLIKFKKYGFDRYGD